MLLAACASEGSATDQPSTSGPGSSVPSSTATTAAPAQSSTVESSIVDTIVDVGDVPTHFAVTPVVVGEQTLVVALADTPGLRSQGLMNVTDLGDLDGMLFAFDEESNQTFWMKDTLIPLDIAFFANNGALVSQTTMIPCEADPCPTYESEGPARYALEVPAGDLDLLGDVSGLALGLPY